MSRIIYAPGAPKARATALSWVGRAFKAGWCLYFQLVHIYRVPGVGDADRDGDADCLDYWKAAVARGRVVKAPTDSSKLAAFIKDIPAGALIIWKGGHGHAGFALGNGEMVGTDLPTRGFVGRHKVSLVKTRWGKVLLGYVLLDGNGFTLIQPETPPVEPPPPAVYEVTAKSGLIGRAGPSTKTEALAVSAFGDKLVMVKQVEGDSRQWLVDASKPQRYYSMEYLRKVG